MMVHQKKERPSIGDRRPMFVSFRFPFSFSLSLSL